MANRKKNKRKVRTNGNKNRYELDIVIPVYGRPDLLSECLDSIKRTCQGINYKIIIIDDNSTVDMSEVYDSLDSEIVFRSNDKNYGFPYTVNKGVNLGRSDTILILNSDIVLTDGCVSNMMNSLYDDTIPQQRTDPVSSQDSDLVFPIGVVGPKLLFPEDSVDPIRPAGKIQHAGLVFNLTGEPKHIHVGWSKEHPRVEKQRTMQAVTGACIMTRRKVWNLVHKNQKDGGDSSNGALSLIYQTGTFEDVEYCVASRLSQYRVLYEPKAVAYHHVGSSVKDSPNGGFPYKQNLQMFHQRCGQLIMWDEWAHY